jgi:hypothetical protein
MRPCLSAIGPGEAINFKLGSAFVFLLGILFLGCSSSQYATYEIPGSARPPWEIQAQWYGVGDQLTLLINGTVILDTNVNIFSGKGDAEGEYEGRKIRAEVFKRGELFQEKTVVQVFVDGKKAAEFEF